MPGTYHCAHAYGTLPKDAPPKTPMEYAVISE